MASAEAFSNDDAFEIFEKVHETSRAKFGKRVAVSGTERRPPPGCPPAEL